MVIFSLAISFAIGIQDPIIQSFVTKMAGGYISQKTGAEIKIGQLVITPSMTVKISDLQIKDLRDNNLLQFKSLKVSPRINDIANNNIHFKSIEIDSLNANLIRYDGEDKFNLSFLTGLFASDKKKEKKDTSMPPITIDKIKLRGIAFEYWDQNREKPIYTEMHQMDYAHIDVFGIDLDASDITITDGVKCNITLLKAQESSGFEIKSLASLVDVSSKGVLLDNLKVKTNNSDLDLDLHMVYDSFKGFRTFIDSVSFDATIRPSDILLSDIGHFAYIMYEMPDRFRFKGVMKGPVSDFTVKDIVFDFGNDTHFEGAVGFDGLPAFNQCNMFLDVNKMTFSYNDLDKMRIPSVKDNRIPIPEQLSILGKGSLKAHYKGTYYDFKANAEAMTEAGNVEADIVMATDKQKHERSMSGNIKGDGVMLGKIANLEPTVGDIDIDTRYECVIGNGSTTISVNGDVFNAYINGERINDINIDGSLADNLFNGNIKVNDNLVRLSFNGNVDFKSTDNLKADFVADINHLDLYKLHLTDDPKASIQALVQSNFTGTDIDRIEGRLTIDSLVYRGEKGNYTMKKLNATVENDELMLRKIKLDSDYLDLELGGKVNFAALPTSLMQYLNHYSEFPYLNDDIEKSKYKDTEQDFYLRANIIDASTICALFMPQLAIANNTTINGTFTSKSNLLNMTLRSSRVKYGGIAIDSIEVRNLNGEKSSILRLKAKSLLPDKADSTSFGLNDINIVSRLRNDSVFTDIGFTGHQLPDRNKVTLKTKFKAGEKEYGRFSISDGDILIDGQPWRITDDNYIDFKKNESTLVHNVSLTSDTQLLTIDGHLPFGNSDTLNVNFDDLNISVLDFVTKPSNMDFDGIINGNASISGLSQTMSVFADLTIDSLALNGDHYGDAKLLSYWDNQDQSIHLTAGIKDQDIDMLSLRGVYYPNQKYDNIEFRLVLNDLRLNIIEPFTTGLVDRVHGTGSGRFDIIGSLKEPIIEGNLNVKDGGCHIDYLNTYYSFEPKIKLSENLIELENMTLTDTLGNTAAVRGNITHNYLKDFNFNLQIMMRKFLALATTPSNDIEYYGTAFANGIVSINGPLDNINLSIKAATQKGTDVTIPLNSNTQTVKSRDYIVFVSNENDSIVSESINATPKRKLFNIDLELMVNNDADLHIILPGDIGTIEAKGDGNIKIGAASGGDFSLIGNYIIESGQFDLVLENILRKNFSLEKGGVISFSGDPLEGTINASGVYQCKASLRSAGIVTDSTSTRNNVNVESVIYLRDKLLNPNITFGMRLPNANEDLQQSIFSVIDTTNQAVMTQQTISLLVLNSFSNSDNFLSDFNSGSFSVLTAQLNSWLSQISRNFDIGLNYKPGDDLSDDELQIALRTQLFNDYLTIESSFGYINRASTTNSNSASSIVGEVDVYVKLTQNGNLTAHFYNHSNNNTNFYNYSYDRTAPYTQGLGISYSKSFDKFKDMFKRKRINVQQNPNTRIP